MKIKFNFVFSFCSIKQGSQNSHEIKTQTRVEEISSRVARRTDAIRLLGLDECLQRHLLSVQVGEGLMVHPQAQ